MKKLMVAAAIALAASVSQAYNVVWGAANAYVDGWNNDTGKYTPVDYPGTALSSMMVYVFDANATGMSQNYLFDQIINKNGSLDKLGAISSAKTGTDGKVPTETVISATDAYPGVTRSASGGKTYVDVIFAAVATDATTGDQYLYLSSTVSSVLQSSKDTPLSDSNTVAGRKFYDGATAYSAAGWYAVPEPTSGLLLLLGVAGLALRRRRA